MYNLLGHPLCNCHITYVVLAGIHNQFITKAVINNIIQLLVVALIYMLLIIS